MEETKQQASAALTNGQVNDAQDEKKDKATADTKDNSKAGKQA